MTGPRPHLVSLCLTACVALALTGCASGAPPVDLGSGIVTPGGSSTGQGSSSVPVESDTPAPSTSATPSTSASPSTSTAPSTSAGPNGDGASAVPAPFRDEDAEIEAQDQSGDGDTVRIEEVQLGRADGFVAVYSRDRKQLLGFAEVKRSTDDDLPVTVDLDRPITASAPLLVELRADDGNGRFDADLDPRVAGGDDDDSQLVVDRFNYQVR